MSGSVAADTPAGWDGHALRRWRVEDAPWYVKSRDADVLRWTREDPTLTVDECRRAIADQVDSVGGFAIVDGDDRPVGNLGVRLSDGRAELSYWVAAPHRGRGIATYALRAAAEWAAGRPDVTEVFLVTHPENVASQRVAVRAGFVADGTAIAPHECATPDGLVERFVWSER